MESINYNLADFSQKWDQALSNSEELRIALELMRNVMEKFPHKEIYIVGGVPRDLLMGNEIDDVDLATNISFEDLSKHFELRNISKSDSQPVYALLFKEYIFDLAKFREDAQIEAGRQNNISTEIDSFEVDTKRRDLTINSFGIDYQGRVVDYQGGLDDLKNKIIRTVGNPKERFMEDATRILRVFRFAAKMGFDIDPETEKAAIELKHILLDSNMISSESISKEFYKSAKSGRTLANFLIKLQNSNILHDILPEFTNMEGYMHNPKYHPEGGSSVLGHILECLIVSPYSDPVINLAVMFHDFGKAITRGEKDGLSTYHGHEAAGVPIVEAIFNRLRFPELSAADKKAILMAVDRHMLVHNLGSLNLKTLSRLILDPAWNVIKAVGYCDEASRGTGLFDKNKFWEKIDAAEQRVKSVGGADQNSMKNIVKQYIDGNKLLAWFPELSKNRPILKFILADAEEFIMDRLDENLPPSENEVKQRVTAFIHKDAI